MRTLLVILDDQPVGLVDADDRDAIKALVVAAAVGHRSGARAIRFEPLAPTGDRR